MGWDQDTIAMYYTIPSALKFDEIRVIGMLAEFSLISRQSQLNRYFLYHGENFEQFILTMVERPSCRLPKIDIILILIKLIIMLVISLRKA